MRNERSLAKRILLALLASLLVAVLAGAVGGILAPKFAAQEPERAKATTLGQAIATGMNWAALVALFVVPTAIAVVLFRHRKRSG